MKNMYSLLLLSLLALSLADKATFSGLVGHTVALGLDSLVVNTADPDITLITLSGATASKCNHPNGPFAQDGSGLKMNIPSYTTFANDCGFRLDTDDSLNYRTLSNAITVTRGLPGSQSVISTVLKLKFPKTFTRLAFARATDDGDLTLDSVAVTKVTFDGDQWDFVITTTASATGSYRLDVQNPGVNAVPGWTMFGFSFEGENRVQTITFSLKKATSALTCPAFAINQAKIFSATGVCMEDAIECVDTTEPVSIDIGMEVTTADACPITTAFDALTKPEVTTYDSDLTNAKGSEKELFGKSEKIYFDSVFTPPSSVKISGEIESVCILATAQDTECDNPDGLKDKFTNVEGEADNQIAFTIDALNLYTAGAPDVYIKITYTLEYNSAQKRSVHMKSAIQKIIISGDNSSSSTMFIVPFLMAVIFVLIA